MARLRVLAITKIFPNAAEPLSAPFNRQQLAALAARPDVDLAVMATIPWYPGAGLLARWSSAGRLAQVPARETIAGIDVRHPRTLFVPRMAMATWGPLYAASIAPALARYRGAVDVVLGSWLYPDGFAAVIAARLLGVPAVVKLHGSDVNVIAKHPGPRRLVGWALARATRVVAVSRALADEVVALGADRARVAVVMNGVDGALFHPRDRAAARAELGLAPGPLVVYVGNLKEDKGVVDLATAFVALAATRPDVRLAMIGGGAMKPRLEELAARVPGRLVLPGPQPFARVPVWMAAADIIALASWAEGTPNAVLEALASGRRVVATAVGGVPDLITTPVVGALVPPRDPATLAAALGRELDVAYDPAEVAAAGARGGWAASAAALRDVLAAAAAEGAGSA
jgi:teichuronic acid biosynthesis glycosyltransferase TuaC